VQARRSPITAGESTAPERNPLRHCGVCESLSQNRLF
jgi:hypothetical protein